MDWQSLIFGKISREDILRYCYEDDWQAFRLELKGLPLEEKYKRLKEWLRKHKNSHAAQVQVTNYVNALARGGLVGKK